MVKLHISNFTTVEFSLFVLNYTNFRQDWCSLLISQVRHSRAILAVVPTILETILGLAT